jgi:hypothetical protein
MIQWTLRLILDLRSEQRLRVSPFQSRDFGVTSCRTETGSCMEGEGQIAETLCEVAEELPWRKLLHRGRGEVGKTQTSEVRMEGFNETDAANLQRVKDAMAERAVGGGVLGGPDAAAASAFAALLDAETRRAELAAKSQGQDKGAASAPSASWAESVTGRAGNVEAFAAAA